MNRAPISILILAGGLGERFGYYKPLYVLEGKPIIKNLIEKISGLKCPIYISIRYNWQERAIKEVLEEDFKVEYIYDKREFDFGALNGVLSSIDIVDEGYLMTIPADSILDQKTYLVLRDSVDDVDGVFMMHCGTLEPMPSIIRVDLLRLLYGYVYKLNRVFRMTDLIRICSDQTIVDLGYTYRYLDIDYPITKENLEDVYREELSKSLSIYKVSFKINSFLKYLESLAVGDIESAVENLLKEVDTYSGLGIFNVSHHIRLDLSILKKP